MFLLHSSSNEPYLFTTENIVSDFKPKLDVLEIFD